MVNRGLALLAALVVVGTGVVGLAAPASADPIVVNPAAVFECHATATVVPTEVFADPRLGWWEGGTLSGSGTCRSSQGTAPLTFGGSWERFGSGGGCPAAWFHLDVQGPFPRFQTWREMTSENPAVASRVIGINPFYVPPGGVPVGYGSFSVPVATSFGVATSDPVACAAWPTTPGEEPQSSPAPPPFQVVADWNISGYPFPTTPPSLLSACVTVQGVLPRTCV